MRRSIAVAVAVLAAALTGSVSTRAQVGFPPGTPPDQACDTPSEAMSLFAVNRPSGRIAYGLTPQSARVPGPTIEMNEGDCLAITLVNDTDKRIGLHAHGVEYTVQSDGTPVNASCVAPGRARTYVLHAAAPSERADGTLHGGTAGYWHYHDHCRGTPHGTDGVRRGAFGALIVRRAGDPRPDRDPFVVVMSGNRINLRHAPRTPMFEADLGDKVEFVVIGHMDDFHTFHLHGHRWADTRTGLLTNPAEIDSVPLRDNKTVGPADSFGFQVVAGEGVGPGAWMYHCHVQGHSDAGMAGLFIVRTEEGELTAHTAAAIGRWKRQHAGH